MGFAVETVGHMIRDLSELMTAAALEIIRKKIMAFRELLQSFIDHSLNALAGRGKQTDWTIFGREMKGLSNFRDADDPAVGKWCSFIKALMI